jgi:hypothetical protein
MVAKLVPPGSFIAPPGATLLVPYSFVTGGLQLRGQDGTTWRAGGRHPLA